MGDDAEKAIVLTPEEREHLQVPIMTFGDGDRWPKLVAAVEEIVSARLAAHMAAPDELTALRKAKTHWHMAYKGLEDGIRALADEWDQPYGEFMGHPDDVARLRELLGDA